MEWKNVCRLMFMVEVKEMDHSKPFAGRGEAVFQCDQVGSLYTLSAASWGTHLENTHAQNCCSDSAVSRTARRDFDSKLSLFCFLSTITICLGKQSYLCYLPIFSDPVGFCVWNRDSWHMGLPYFFHPAPNFFCVVSPWSCLRVNYLHVWETRRLMLSAS